MGSQFGAAAARRRARNAQTQQRFLHPPRPPGYNPDDRKTGLLNKQPPQTEPQARKHARRERNGPANVHPTLKLGHVSTAQLSGERKERRNATCTAASYPSGGGSAAVKRGDRLLRRLLSGRRTGLYPPPPQGDVLAPPAGRGRWRAGDAPTLCGRVTQRPPAGRPRRKEGLGRHAARWREDVIGERSTTHFFGERSRLL